MPLALALALALLLPGPAFAHGPGGSGWTVDAWTVDGWSAGPLAVTAALYLAGFRRWQRDRASLFWAGWLVAAVAVLSPLYDLGERSFAAHMVEHELLMVIAAPLLAASRPLGILLAPLPAGTRRAGGWGVLWAAATGPVVATALHGTALWIWHLPALFDAALESRAVHALQHFSLFGTALLFWWAVLVGRGPVALGGAVFGLFVTALHGTLLAALLTLSPAPWYAYGIRDAAAALDDQRLAGLIMWVPGSLAYVGIALALLARWLRLAGRTAE